MTRQILIAIGVALGLAAASPAQAQRLWLLVGASDGSAAALAKKAQALAAKLPSGLIMQTRDCGEPNNAFAWVAELVSSAEAAQLALPRVREVVPDAYIKRCDAKPGSLLALRIPAIDPSIAAVPADTVNWREQDRVSAVQALGALGEGRSLLIARYFSDEPNDPLEGRRERVSVVEASGQRQVLQTHCLGAGRVSALQGMVAFQCVRESAANELLHSVLAFDAAGRKLAEIAHCRNPRWSGARTLVCDAESVDASGRLSLRRKQTPVAALPAAVPAAVPAKSPTQPALK